MPWRVSTRPGVPSPMPEHGVVAGGQQCVDELVDQRQRFVTAPAGNGKSHRADDLAAQIHHRAAEFIAGQVHADEVLAVAHDAEQDRRFAARALAIAHFFDQALAIRSDTTSETVVRVSWVYASHLGPAHFASVVDRLEDELAVVRLGLLLGGFFHDFKLLYS